MACDKKYCEGKNCIHYIRDILLTDVVQTAIKWFFVKKQIDESEEAKHSLWDKLKEKEKKNGD